MNKDKNPLDIITVEPKSNLRLLTDFIKTNLQKLL
jgi:hypothetical protein